MNDPIIKDQIIEHSREIAAITTRLAALEAQVLTLETGLAQTSNNIDHAVAAAEQSFDSVDRHHRELANDFDDYRSVAEYDRSQTEARIAQLEREKRY